MMVVSVLKPFIRIWKCWMLTSIELLHRIWELIYWIRGIILTLLKKCSRLVILKIIACHSPMVMMIQTTVLLLVL